ncbi:MAG TPA: hypothetical protein VFH71_03720 [Rhodanobacteraceae bacterium]|nr:hypothetical protein [Rhodanobacteraceae bacterium]
MKIGKWLAGMILVVAALQAGIACAADSKPVVKATNKDDFAAVAAAIRQQIGPGGRWQYTSKSEKADIDSRLNDMQGLFDKFGTVDQMDQPAKQQLFSDQEAVNDILTRRDGNRMICENEIPTGSHIPKRVCRTYAQMRQDEQDAQTMMHNTRTGTPGINGGG